MNITFSACRTPNMNSKKRMFPFHDLPYLEDNNGIYKRQCLQKTIAMPDVLQKAYTVDNSMEWDVSNNCLPKHEEAPVTAQAPVDKKTSVCLRCQSGEAGHIRHIAR